MTRQKCCVQVCVSEHAHEFGRFTAQGYSFAGARILVAAGAGLVDRRIAVGHAVCRCRVAVPVVVGQAKLAAGHRTR